MNVFQKIMADYPLGESTNPVDALLFALFQYAATDYEGSDVYANPVKEVLRRLEARGVGPIALDIIRPRLHTLAVRYGESL